MDSATRAKSGKSGMTINRSEGCSRYTAPGSQTSVPKLQDCATYGWPGRRLRPAQPPSSPTCIPRTAPALCAPGLPSAGVAQAGCNTRHSHQQGLLQRAVQSGFAAARAGQQLGLQAVQRVQVGIAQADEFQRLGAVRQ